MSWLKPAMTSTIVRDTRTHRLQMMSQGNLPFLLANSSEYWDGTTIWPLTQQRRSAILAMYQQWKSEDLHCVAVAYDPVSHQEASLFGILSNATSMRRRREAAHSMSNNSISSAGANAAAIGSGASGASDTLPLHPAELGLGFDNSHIYLLARAGDLHLNAQVDARAKGTTTQQLKLLSDQVAAGGDTIMDANATSMSVSGNRVGGQNDLSMAGVAPDTTGTSLRLAEIAEARLMRMQSGQIFVGVVAARFQPQPKVQDLIKDLGRSGIRFVYMANRNYRKTKPLATKMGLETGWNCAISLMPRRFKPHTPTDRERTTVDAATAARMMQAQTAVEGLGEYELDGEEDDDFGVEGTMTEERRLKKLQGAKDEEEWDLKAGLPHGVPEIRAHLVEKDNVPLLVSLFTEATPPAIAGMLRIMQEHGEQVLVLCSALRKSSPLLCSVADLAVAVSPVGSLESFRAAQVSLPLAESAVAVRLNGTGIHAQEHVRLAFSSSLPSSDLKPMGVIPEDRPLFSSDDKYAGQIGPTEFLEDANAPGGVPVPLPLEHPYLRFTTTIAALHCALTLPADLSVHIVLKTLADGRRALDTARQSLAFSFAAQVTLAALALLDIVFALPGALQPSHIIWLVAFVIPALSATLLFTPAEDVSMSEKRTPAKRGDASGESLWDILPAPSASPDSLPQAEGDIRPGMVSTGGDERSSVRLGDVNPEDVDAAVGSAGMEPNASTSDSGQAIDKRVTDQTMDGQNSSASHGPSGLQSSHSEGTIDGGCSVATDLAGVPLMYAASGATLAPSIDEEVSAVNLSQLDIHIPDASDSYGTKRDGLYHRSVVDFGEEDTDNHDDILDEMEAVQPITDDTGEIRPVVYAGDAEGDDEFQIHPADGDGDVDGDGDFNDKMDIGDIEHSSDYAATHADDAAAEIEIREEAEELAAAGADLRGDLDVDMAAEDKRDDMRLEEGGESPVHDEEMFKNDGYRRFEESALQAEAAGDGRIADDDSGSHGNARGEGRAVRFATRVMPRSRGNGAGVGKTGKIKPGATPYNPRTGGVHAESLIRYAAYADVTSALAGNTCNISTRSARRAAEILTSTRRRRSAADHTKRGLSSTAAAASVVFTRGIAPSQGLPSTPPKLRAPKEWKRFVWYGVVACLPCAFVHEYIYARAFGQGLMHAGLLGGQPAWGFYPLFDLSRDSLAPSAAVDEHVVIRRWSAWGEAVTLLSLVVWVVAMSAHAVYRSHPFKTHSPLRNKVWAWCAAIVIAVQVAHSHIVTANADAPSIFTGSTPMPWDVWVVSGGWLLISFWIFDRIKRHDGRLYERAMQSRRLNFDTRLGMYSPK
jgi:hypothetical protein